MSKIEQIISFINVVEAKSFSLAGKKQKCSTASISRKVAQLEVELGAELLQRTTRQVSLTAIGALYYEQCKKTLNELTDAEIAITSTQNEAIGILNIVSTPHLCTKLIIPRLSEFLEQNPNLQVNLELAEQFPDLKGDSVDLFFGASLEGPDEIVRRKICTTRYVLVASANYLKKYSTPVQAVELKEHKYITHTTRNPNNVIFAKDGNNILLTPSMWLNSAEIMKACAINGLGIANLHDYVVNDSIRDQQLVEILPDLQTPEINVYLYYKKTKYLKTKIRKFIDFYLSEQV